MKPCTMIMLGVLPMSPMLGFAWARGAVDTSKRSHMNQCSLLAKDVERTTGFWADRAGCIRSRSQTPEGEDAPCGVWC